MNFSRNCANSERNKIKYREFEIYFSKIEWDRRTYSILIIHKDNQALNRNENNEMKRFILGFLK